MKALVVAGLAATLCGCAGFTGIDSDRPKGFGPAMLASDCPDIAGDFDNAGYTRYDASGGWSFLALHIAAPRAWAAPGDLRRIERVRIEFPDRDTMRVTAYRDGAALDARRYDRNAGQFRCEAGRLILPTVGRTSYEMGAVVTERSLSLERLADGDLAGQEHLRAYGAALFVVPFGGSQDFWFRWNRKPTDPQPATR